MRVKSVWQTIEDRVQGEKTRCGFLLNHRAWWVGFHWSSYNRRLCVNLIPCCTFWVALKGGNVPRKGNL